MSADRFSKVSRRMWVDSGFAALSAPQANAQTLWLYLLTGPHCTAIPGLFVLGEMAIAEFHGWTVEETRRCVKEIVAAGMAQFDRRSRVWWMPNALKHNMPHSHKNVQAWADPWRLLPECDFVRGVAASIRTELAARRGPAFCEAFEEVVGPVDEEAPPSSGTGNVPPGRVTMGDPMGDAMGDPIQKRNEMPSPMACPIGSQERDPDPERDQEIRPNGRLRRAPAREPAGRGGPDGQSSGPESVTGDKADSRAAEGARLRLVSSDGSTADQPLPTRPGATAAPLRQHDPDAPVRPSDLLPDERSVYDALHFKPTGWDSMRPPPLAHLARGTYLRQLAAHGAPGGRLDMADVVLAIQQAAENEAAQSNAGVMGRNHGTLAAFVAGCVKRVTRGEARNGPPQRGGSARPKGPALRPASERAWSEAQPMELTAEELANA
jgi:hypothetical protein